MRHGMYGRKLGRKSNHRIAMRRNMASSLFMHGQITTTIPKAKSLQPFVERIITAAKKGDLASRRHVIQMLGQDQIMVRGEDDESVDRNRYGEIQGGPKLVKHIFEEIAPKFADRQGGYTRIIKLSKHRIGDASDLCVLMLVGEEEAGGPQLAGQYSRRRDKANKRMEFAASLRKGGAAAVAEAETETDAEAAGDVEATATDETVEQADEQVEEKAEAREEQTPNSEESGGSEEDKKD